MIRIALVGNIGCGKTFVAYKFGYPVFNADFEVSKLYNEDRTCFRKLNKKFPKYITSFPIAKEAITLTILKKNSNLKKIIKIIHPIIRKKMNRFLLKNKNRKIVILDIPLFLENKICNKKDILVFIDSPKKEIIRRLKRRPSFNTKLFKKFKSIQFTPAYKKRKAQFIIKNKFTKKSVSVGIKKVLQKV